MYGAEKRQWYEGEVEGDAERAGCFAERQLRLGLVVDGVTPEYVASDGTPAERTKGSGQCGLVRTEETGPSLWLVKSHFGFTGFRCENMFRRTGNPDTFRRPNHREPSSTKNQETPVQNWL